MIFTIVVMLLVFLYVSTNREKKMTDIYVTSGSSRFVRSTGLSIGKKKLFTQNKRFIREAGGSGKFDIAPSRSRCKHGSDETTINLITSNSTVVSVEIIWCPTTKLIVSSYASKRNCQLSISHFFCRLLRIQFSKRLLTLVKNTIFFKH